MVDTKVIEALQHTAYITLEFTTIINTMLTIPSVTIEVERQRCIKAINTVTVYYRVEEGRPIPQLIISSRRPATDNFISAAKQQYRTSEDKLNG